MKDVIVIGAGILGVTAARMLAKYELDVLVLEKGSDIGEGASKANSGVLAAGYHARGGSLKGISGARGNRMYRKNFRWIFNIPDRFTVHIMRKEFRNCAKR